MKANKKTNRVARQLFRLCFADGVLDQERARQVARRIGASKRRGALSVLSSFQRLVRLDVDRHTAVVESATPLADEMRAKIQADLSRVYGSTLDASFEENPALIAGMRIRVGSDVYDGSVRARLAAIENSFTDSTAPPDAEVMTHG
jgi:F-type H+-transporting ATPase subunit delta